MEDPTQDQPQTPEVSTPEEKSDAGAWIASVIIVVIIFIGGIYFWNNIKSVPITDTDDDKEEMSEEVSSELPANDETIEDLETDLQSVDIEELDSELDEIDAEFDAALEEL